MTTLCSLPNQEYLIESLHKIHTNQIPGDIVETGVFRGGMMMIAATTLLELGNIRDLWLYDTYQGMPEAGEHDQKLDGSPMLGKHVCTLGEVKGNMLSTGYPKEFIHYVKGNVEDTLPSHLPEEISLLRLDTDFYTSTQASLENLFPRLHPEGILIIDDYHCWKGCQKAVKEYFPSFEIIKIDKSAVEVIPLPSSPASPDQYTSSPSGPLTHESH